MEGKKKRRRKEEAELSLCIYKGLPLFPVAKSLRLPTTTHCAVKILFFFFFLNTCWHLFSSHEKEKEEKLPTTIVNLAEEARRNEPP